MLVQPDGRVVVAHAAGGQYEPGTHTIRRLNADGKQGASFGSGGAIQPDVGTRLSDVALQRDGGLIVVGAREASGDFIVVIARYLANGSPDSAFGGGGFAPVELADRWRESVRTVGDPGPRAAILADGRIRIPVSVDMPRREVQGMGVLGLTKNGHPDPRLRRARAGARPAPRAT